MDFVDALKIAQDVMDQYKCDHPKWWKRMDGTPILNDLPVRMASEFAIRTAETLPAGIRTGNDHG